MLLIALLSGGAFYGYKGGLFGGGTASSTITGPIDAAKNAKDLLEKNNQAVVDEVSTADWKTYRNEEYKFVFSYPSSYELKIGALVPREGGPTPYVVSLSSSSGDIFSVEARNDWKKDNTGTLYLEGHPLSFLDFKNKNCNSIIPGTSIVAALNRWGEDITVWNSYFILTSEGKGLSLGWTETAPGGEARVGDSKTVIEKERKIEEERKVVMKTFQFEKPVQAIPFECRNAKN